MIIHLWVSLLVMRRYQLLYQPDTEMSVCEEVMQLQQNPVVWTIPSILALETVSCLNSHTGKKFAVYKITRLWILRVAESLKRDWYLFCEFPLCKDLCKP